MSDLVIGFRPTHLGLFVFDRVFARPLAHLPVYAEVIWVEPDPPPPPPDLRFRDHVGRALALVDEACGGSAECRSRLEEEVGAALARVLTAESRDYLAADFERGIEFLVEVIRRVQDAAGVQTLDGLPRTDLRAHIEEAVEGAAQAFALATTPPSQERERTPWIYPLGVLASDHVGYLSFDLTRLPGSVQLSIRQTIEALRKGEAIETPTAIRVAPYGHSGWFDALEQRRFAHDAIVTRIELDQPRIPATLANLGFLSMQNPSLTDWRLSPASFATNPAALLGDRDGCESLLPANVALHEYRFYQVVGLNDVEAELLPPPAGGVRLGVVHEYRLAWYPLGHSLGQILYSAPLAPGESINLAVVDWTRRDDAQRAEHTSLDEQIVHREHRDRVITETVNAAIREFQHGSSFMGGVASSAGASGSMGAFGIAAGLAGSLGGSTASSDGARDIAASTVQNISDNISQVSTAARELQSTVVVHATQSEKEAIETRTIVNYNHSHALTVLYYEVLRHFRVVTEAVRRRPAVLVKMRDDWFTGDAAETNAREHRAALQASLLDPSLAGAFDALERIERRRQSAIVTAPPVPPPPPPSAPGPALRFFVFDMKTGGIASRDVQVSVSARLWPTGHKLSNGGPFNPPGAFTEKNANNSFVGLLPAGVPPVNWGDIDMIEIGVDIFKGDESDTDIAFQHIKVTGIDVDGGALVLVDKSYSDGHLILTNDAVLILPTTRPAPPPAPPPRPAEEVDDEVKRAQLLAHLEYHKAHYSRALLFAQNATERAASLAAIKLADGSSIADRVENRPLEIVGDYVAYPCTNGSWNKAVEARLSDDAFDVKDERLVTLPTRGVFAEAKLGHCNASELIDNTRFWDWQQSPIPHLAPEIAPIQAVTPQPQQQNLQSTPFPQSLVNIVNPPAAPDPTGLAAAMNVLATPNIFRDMSGRAEVADLLKKLSDNSISIAEAAGRAREIQTKYASALGGGAGSGMGGIGGARAAPNEPSRAARDLQDLQGVLGRAQQANLLSPEDARSAYQEAVRDALGLQQAQDVYVPSATAKNELIGLVGEVHLAEALEREGVIVFRDWSKHVSATGIDLVALDPRGASPEVLLLDNKGQMKGIAGANALTGTNFETYKKQAIEFLKSKSPHPRALEAANLIEQGKFKKVVANAWSGADTRFTKKMLESGLQIYDVRLGKRYDSYGAWEAEFKALPKPLRRMGRVRGSATVGSMLLVLAVSAGSLFVLRSDAALQQALGEFAAETALGAVLSRLPGGFIAGMVIGMESDETPSQRAARKRKETIDTLCGSIPGFLQMSAAEQTSIADEIGKMLDDPLIVPDPPAPPGRKQILPGLDSPVPQTDWA